MERLAPSGAPYSLLSFEFRKAGSTWKSLRRTAKELEKATGDVHRAQERVVEVYEPEWRSARAISANPHPGFGGDGEGKQPREALIVPLQSEPFRMWDFLV